MKYTATNSSDIAFEGPCQLTVKSSIGLVPEATLTFPWTAENISRIYGEISGEAIMPKKLIFNDPATIVYWQDGAKTVVKCQEGTEFNPYYGFCAALAKKIFGKNSTVNRIVKNAEVHKTAANKEKSDSEKQKAKERKKSYESCRYKDVSLRKEPCYDCVNSETKYKNYVPMATTTDSVKERNCMNTEGDRPNFIKVETHNCWDCEHENKRGNEEPCVNCVVPWKTKWEPKKQANGSAERHNCMNCKHGDLLMGDEPCRSCIFESESKWEPEEGD